MNRQHQTDTSPLVFTPRRRSSSVNIEVHIERLILDGLAVEANRRGEVQAAVEAELTRLLSSGGLSPHLLVGGMMPSVPATSIQLTPHYKPIDLGRHIAGGVHGAIGK